jgi:hypothetical protein
MNSLRKFGTGKMNMVVKSTINSEDSVSPSIGKDLLSLLMSKETLPSGSHSSECSIKVSFIELPDLSTGVAISELLSLILR